MAGPQNPRSEQTRERILLCACELLANQESVFSFRATARHAEVSLGTLQYHFIDKQSLVDACIETVYKRLREVTPVLVKSFGENAENPQDIVTHAVQLVFRHARANMPFIRVLEASVVHNGGLDIARHTSLHDPLLTSMADYLAKSLGTSQHEGRLRINSLIMIGARYAIMHEEALAEVFTPPEGKGIVETVEEHLVSLALLVVSASNR